MSLYDFKVVVLGQCGVGKTSLALRFVSNIFNDSHGPTSQAGCLKKHLYLGNDMIRLQLWDTAGHESLGSMVSINILNIEGAIILYDVTEPDSLRWAQRVAKDLTGIVGSDKIKLAIVGNKIDLIATVGDSTNHQLHEIPSIKEGINYADRKKDASHYLISAKLNQGIDDMFVDFTRLMINEQRVAIDKQIKSEWAGRSRIGCTTGLVLDELPKGETVSVVTAGRVKRCVASCHS